MNACGWVSSPGIFLWGTHRNEMYILSYIYRQVYCLSHVARGVLPFCRSLMLVVLSTFVFYLSLADNGMVPVPEKVIAGAEKKYGPRARLRLQAWNRLVAENCHKTEKEKLQAVNRFFNLIRYVSDRSHWGVRDYWATPIEMLASNGADCEDFAIAKYFTLVALRIKQSKLKIMYVKASSYNPINRSHMVLTYYEHPGAVPLVLDNLIGEIKPATERRDLTPVYAFNAQGLWLAKVRSLGRVAGGSKKIRPWREMTSRMGREF